MYIEVPKGSEALASLCESDDEDRDIGRGDAGDARSLTNGLRVKFRKFLTSLVGESRERKEIEIGRDDKAVELKDTRSDLILLFDIALIFELYLSGIADLILKIGRQSVDSLRQRLRDRSEMEQREFGAKEKAGEFDTLLQRGSLKLEQELVGIGRKDRGRGEAMDERRGERAFLFNAAETLVGSEADSMRERGEADIGIILT